jgi:hypothetical protein
MSLKIIFKVNALNRVPFHLGLYIASLEAGQGIFIIVPLLYF